ncbi:MAG: hypothetical protein J5697_02640 [Clostridia bacterium]|nr:hypothetical protein [Clostridia bacterium]
MKKLLTLLSSFIIVLALVLSCGCSGKTILSFNNSFNGGANATVEPGLSEICEYSVRFAKKENFSGAEVSDVNYTDGTFVTTLKILSDYEDGGALPETDLYNTAERSIVLKFSTSFSVKAVYTVNGTEKAFDDTIESVVYFLPSEKSFAPLYSKTEKHSGNPFGEVGEYFDETTEIVYYGSSYKITTEGNYSANDTASIDYTPKTLIDNAQLLFAVRCFDITSTATNIPVVASAYKSAKTLAFTLESDESKTYSITLNGTPADYSVRIKNCSLTLSSTKEAGQAHKFAVQKAGGDLTYKAYLTYYSQPIIINIGGGFPSYLGDLNFTLSSITA